MNAVVPFASAKLVPSNMAEAMRLAEMMATARLVPAGLQKSPADCLMVIQQAIRWDMDPFAVAQECSVIQGKLMHSGKLVAAVVNARGGLVDRLSYDYEGEGDNRTIKVSGRLQGEAQPRHITVRLGDAKTTNKVWQTQPDQQLMYHGARVWARRHTPELMLGVYSEEEFDEPKKPPHNPKTGEITESAGVEQTPVSSVAADAAPATDASPHDAGAALSVEDIAREAAMRGEAVFKAYYRKLTGPAKQRVDAMGNELRAIMDDVYDPAIPDLSQADFIHFRSDINPEHRRNIEAYQHGKRAKADGHARKAIPPEYREAGATRQALAWEAGWAGQPMPEFGE